MNANQLINMILRPIIRRLVNHGIDAGINAASKRDSAGRASPQNQRGDAGLKQNAKQINQAAKMMRRINRF